jgi:hypothetical protein
LVVHNLKGCRSSISWASRVLVDFRVWSGIRHFWTCYEISYAEADRWRMLSFLMPSLGVSMLERD